jgi:hypothetical protein
MATTTILGKEITALSASYAETASYVIGGSSSPFPYTGSATISGSLGVTGLVNNVIASNSNLGITQSVTASYSAGTQFVANGFYPASVTGSVSHDYSSGSAIVRSGVTKGNAFISGLGVTIPQEIAGMNVVAGTDYAAISAQYQGSGTPGTQIFLTNVDGGNFQTSFNMDNATANPSMQMKIYDSQSKFHQLSISKGDPGFAFTNTMTNTTMSLLSVSNSASAALFSVFQDKKIQIDSSLTITGSITQNASTASFAGIVGIGTTTPTQKLEVNGNALIKTSFVGTITAFGDNYASFSHTARAGTNDYSILSDNIGTTYLNASSSQNIKFRIDNIDKAILDSTGNIGVGTTTPDTKIHAVNDFYCFLKAEVPSYGYMQMGSSGGYGIISTNNSQSIKINTDGDLVIFAGGSFSERARFTAIGLGIGDPSYNTPEYTLDVTGTGRFKSGSFISGSLNITGSQVITGSLRGNVSVLSISSNTASIDMSSNNFFTLTLANGANTHISPTNMQPGQTVNIRVTQGSLGTGTVSFPTFVDQASGSLYTGSMVSNAIDIVTMITFDSTTVFMSSIRNMI